MPLPLLPAAGFLGYSAINGFMSLFNRKSQIEANEKLQVSNHAFQDDLEEKRRDMQMMQMQLSVLQQEKNQAFQMELAELGHQKAQELEGLRQSFQAWLAKSNYQNARDLQASGHQNALELEDLRQSCQKWLAEFNSEKSKELQALGHEKALEMERIRQSFQGWLAEFNHRNARELAELGHQKAQELERIRQSFQGWLAEYNNEKAKELQALGHENAIELEKFRQTFNIALNDKNLNFQKWRFEQEKIIQYKILQLQQEFQREITQIQHENARQLLQDRIRNEKSPLTFLASDLLQAPFLNGVMPLKILLAPPQLNYEPRNGQESAFKGEFYLAEEIRQFLRNRYHINSPERPTVLLDRAWSSKKYGGGSAVHSFLYPQLQTIPVLILESEMEGDRLNFRYYFWGGDQTKLIEDTMLSRFPYKRWLYESAKERALAWKEKREILKRSKIEEQEIKRLGGIDEENLAILEKELDHKAKYQGSEDDFEKMTISRAYKLTAEDYEALYQQLSVLHCIVIGLVADSLFLQRSFRTKPLLPTLLPSLLEQLPNSSREKYQQTAQEVIKLYGHLYESLEPHLSRWVPELMLDFAVSLTELQDSSLALEQANRSVALWLRLNGVDEHKVFDVDNDADCQLLRSLIYQEDEPYFEGLKKLVDQWEANPDLDWVQGKSLVVGWQRLKNWGSIPKLPEIKPPEPTQWNAIPTETPLQFSDSFEAIAVNRQGNIIARTQKQIPCRVEDLGGGVSLPMVSIPSGTLWMGTPDAEAKQLCDRFNVDYFNSETPQHLVALTAFEMGKYPITQGQWKAIALRHDLKMNIDLNPEPSKFKGDNRPVEGVSWVEAVEFCQRLAKLTGKNYCLPSEAQWEYACRAGTNTPFNVGETLTSELANYDTNYVFAEELKGNNRQQTTEVGQFYPNSFGLYDLHGNVWEWCEDDWHENYVGAPQNGQAWVNLDGNGAFKVMRGGSWGNPSPLCRCAYRSNHDMNQPQKYIGFRVVVADVS